MKKIYTLSAIIVCTFIFAQNTLNVGLQVTNFGVSGNSQNLTENNGNIIFSARRESRAGGNELWLYNSTTNKSSVLKNFKQNQNYSNRIKSNIVKFNNKHFFIATETGDANNQLWETDGTAEGTKLIKHLYNSSTSGNEICFVRMGKLFIHADYQLYVSDGTAEGTVPLFEIPSGGKYYEMNGKLYFWRSGYPSDDLMETDGTVEGTKIFKTFERANTDLRTNNEVMVIGSEMYFIAKLNGVKSLWKSDGTDAGTKRVANVTAPTLKGQPMGNKIIYYDDSNKLWISDGTPENTVSYKTITGTIQSIFTFKDNIYVDTTDGFWKTDGTEANTYLFPLTEDDKKVSRLAESSAGNYLVLREDIEYSQALWLWDGTENLAAKLKHGKSYALPGDFLEMNNYLYFAGYSVDNGSEIFKYNMATREESLVTDVNFSYDSNPMGYSTVAGNVFYNAYTGGQFTQIFKKNILSGETQQITNFKTQYGAAGKSFKVGNYYYAINERNVYRSDGSVANSNVVNFPAEIKELFVLNDDSVILITYTGSLARVYRLDNTSMTPVIIKEKTASRYMTNRGHGIINNELYFVFPDDNNHLKIFKTDGTPANTQMTIEFPYDNLENLKIIGTVNSKLVFFKVTNNYGTNADLYSSAGNQESVTLLSTLAYVPNGTTTTYLGKLYFLTQQLALHATDGSVAGTKLIRSVGTGSNYGEGMMQCGKYFFIFADYTLWRSDGTMGGTIQMGSNLNPNQWTCNKDYLYAASTSAPKLFRTDGERTRNISLDINVSQNNTDVTEDHVLLNVPFKNLFSDGKTIYFTGYGNISDFHQYVVLDELPQYLATNESNGLNKNYQVTIYPNPAVSEMNVSMQNNETIKKVEIIDPIGRIVMTSLSAKNIDISKLNQQVYFINIYTDSEIYTSKLLKK